MSEIVEMERIPLKKALKYRSPESKTIYMIIPVFWDLVN